MHPNILEIKTQIGITKLLYFVTSAPMPYIIGVHSNLLQVRCVSVMFVCFVGLFNFLDKIESLLLLVSWYAHETTISPTLG